MKTESDKSPGREHGLFAKRLSWRTHRMLPRRARRLLFPDLGLAILLAGFAAITAGCGQDSRAETAFQAVVGRGRSSGLSLKTERTTYTKGDRIVFWVENHTDQDVWFVDDNFGVRGYSYNSGEGVWREVDLGNRIIDPRPWKVPAHHKLYIMLGNLDTNYFAQSGPVRLVARGCLSSAPVGELCADYFAYQDVLVKPRQ